MFFDLFDGKDMGVGFDMEAKKQHRVLIIDDAFTNREILKEILKDEAEVVEFDNGKDALGYLMDHFYDLDIVLLDLVMPEMNGFEVLEFMRRKHMTDYLPVIMISADDEERNMEYAFDLGAIDFIARPFSERIVLRRVLTTISLFEKQKELIRQIDVQFKPDDQKIDELTGLPYKQNFYNKVHSQLLSSGDMKLWMVAIDIDHFKLFNNFYGWEKGDQYLRLMGRYLSEFTRRHGGIAGYLGGDDFAVLCPNKSAAMEELEKKMTQDTKRHKSFGVGFGPKFGFYEIENNADSVEKIYNNAVIALDSIAGDYTKRVAWYDQEMIGNVQNEFELLSDIQRGVDNKEFVFYLQPKVDMKTKKVVGAEALARWQHHDKGLISPGVFIPILEKNGFVSSIDYDIWNMVIEWIASMLKNNVKVPPVSINISRADIYAMNVAETLQEMCDKNKVPYEYLEVEITETAYMEDFDLINAMVEKLHAIGFKVSMDDFGSGYSSLNALKNMNVDVLKIDMRFLDFDHENHSKGVSILESVLNMAKTLALPTIVEGVETKDQSEMLMEQGCELAQGYYYYRPMPVDEFEKLVK